MRRCEGGGAGNSSTSLIFQTQQRVGLAAFMLGCRTGRETKRVSEIPLKEVVISIVAEIREREWCSNIVYLQMMV